ncbi:response regulator transcription factor [Vibrio sp. T20]|uniref:response regulator transcription factor n=1 Tax=Vibrio sp. T20 TaxID=2588450 RepID=UPI0011B37652|nr:response regulator transcription factor [Vibrio sp. T20]
MKILLVDDSFQISETIADYLELRNCIVDFAYNGQDALSIIEEQSFDVVVMDIMMPKMDGISAVKKIRSELNKTVPIIYLSAKDKLEDRLEGFDSGADDYLVKPFSLEELYARITALYNRTNKMVSAIATFKDIQINTEQKQVSLGSNQLKLPPIQYKILLLLIKKAPNLVTKSDIIEHIWGDSEPNSDALRSHMYGVRNAISKQDSQTQLETVFGKGFKLS